MKGSIRDWARLLVRLLAIYFIIHGFGQLFSLITHLISTMPLRNMPDSNIQWSGWFDTVFIAYAALYLLIGVGLWLAAGRLSGMMAPVHMDGQEAVSSTFDFKQVERFVLSAAGLLLILLTVPALFTSIMNHMYLLNQEIQLPDYHMRDSLFRILELLVRLLIGVWLMWKANGIAGFLRKLREAGTNKGDRTS